METRKSPFRDSVGRVYRCAVCGFDYVFGDDVDTALLRLNQVLECVLCSVETTCETKDEQRRVVVNDVEVGIGCQICCLSYTPKYSASRSNTYAQG